MTLIQGSAVQVRYIVFLVGVVLLALSVIFLGEYNSTNHPGVAYAVLIVILGAAPAIVSLISYREANVLPLMPLHGLFYAFTFGLPVFSNKVNWLTDDMSAVMTALALTVLGLLCLLIGYYGSRRFISKKKPFRFLARAPIQKQIFVAWVLYGVSLLYQLFPVLQNVRSLNHLAAPFTYISLGVLFALCLDKSLSRGNVLLFVIVAGLTILNRILTGSLSHGILLLIFLCVVYWVKKRSVPYLFIIVTVLLILILNPVKHVYRSITWGENFSSLTIVDKTVLFYESFQKYYDNEDLLIKVSNDSSTVNRLAHISTLAYVIKLTPERIPYWEGGSYRMLLTSFIPRIVWPDKPQGRIGQEFGHRYSLLNEDDFTTSLNLPWLPEFYVNFGVVGVLAGMLLVGVLFRFLVQKLSVSIDHNFEYILGLTVVFNLFFADSDFANMTGKMLMTYIACLISLRILMYRYVIRGNL